MKFQDDEEEDADDDDEDEGSTGYEQLNLLRNVRANGDVQVEGDEDFSSEGSDSEESHSDIHPTSTGHITKAPSEENTNLNVTVSASVALKKTIAHASSSVKTAGKHLQHSTADQNENEDGERDEKKKKKKTGEEGEDISVTNAASHSLAGYSTSIGSPPNFSKVDTTLPLESLKLMFPLYYEALTNSSIRSGSSSSNSSSPHDTEDHLKSSDNTISQSITSNGCGVRCMQVTIKAGEMLYIPTGWFHEVRSTGGGIDGHLALNYWFHPPDGLTFEKPYTTDFWVNDWNRRNLTQTEVC